MTCLLNNILQIPAKSKDRKTLEKIYLTFIRPILEYADVVWNNKILFLINKLENVQIQAARIVTAGTRLVSINSLYEETGWETLQARRENYKKTYFYKMVNGLVPPYLRAIVRVTLQIFMTTTLDRP